MGVQILNNAQEREITPSPFLVHRFIYSPAAAAVDPVKLNYIHGSHSQCQYNWQDYWPKRQENTGRQGEAAKTLISLEKDANCNLDKRLVLSKDEFIISEISICGFVSSSSPLLPP